MVDRHRRLDTLLQSGSFPSKRQIASELETSPRSVDRYIQDLRDQWQADVIFDRDRGGYGYRDGTKGLPIAPRHFTEGELVALCVTAAVLAQYRGTPFESEFQRVFEKITQHLPKKAQGKLSLVPGRVGVKAAVPAKAELDQFRILLDAVLSEKPLKLTYYSAYRGASSERVVEPYALHHVAGHWYLIAWCRVRKKVLAFHTTRIWVAARDKGEFERPRPARFRAEDYLGDAFGVWKARDDDAKPVEVRVLFDDFAARYVRETLWHPSQKNHPREGGELEVQVQVSDTVELEAWILSWCEHARVLSPESLAKRLATRLTAARRKYEPAEGNE